MFQSTAPRSTWQRWQEEAWPLEPSKTHRSRTVKHRKQWRSEVRSWTMSFLFIFGWLHSDYLRLLNRWAAVNCLFDHFIFFHLPGPVIFYLGFMTKAPPQKKTLGICENTELISTTISFYPKRSWIIGILQYRPMAPPNPRTAVNPIFFSPEVERRRSARTRMAEGSEKKKQRSSVDVTFQMVLVLKGNPP